MKGKIRDNTNLVTVKTFPILKTIDNVHKTFSNFPLENF